MASFHDSLQSLLLSVAPTILLNFPPFPDSILLANPNYNRQTNHLSTYADISYTLYIYTPLYLSHCQQLSKKSYLDFEFLVSRPERFNTIRKKWDETKRITGELNRLRAHIRTFLVGLKDLLGEIEVGVEDLAREVEMALGGWGVDGKDLARLIELRNLRMEVKKFLDVVWEGRMVLRKTRKEVGKTGRAMWGFSERL
jgi:hypothetical protein